MNFKALKIFCDVTKLRSFSKAAEVNGISQSNASQVVHHLEEHLGVQLIDRSTRPFVMTPEGEKYFDGARDICRRLEDLEREVVRVHDQVASRLTVAAIYSVGLAHMNRWLRAFLSQHPKADVRVEYVHPERVYEAVETEQADLGLVSYPVASKRIETLPWREERLVLVVDPAHPLAERSRSGGGLATVSINDLEGERLIASQQGLQIREEVDSLFARHKVGVEVAMEFDNIELMKRAIEIGAGVGLLPEPTVTPEVAAGTLVKLSLEGEQLARPLGILYRRDRELSETAQRFIKLLQDHANETTTAAPTPSHAKPVAAVARESLEPAGAPG
ncbi:HTH-type transcriptional activator CmpR [Pseudobythopirellula maris]|uniref:HTH-type transcriptional activator CmpR n=1 Tax=Pseudobythopirellula maris TaxID=2527991 RepID=A0A5C5ZLK0_9BACT|nr:LysR family transcriptional regulator [Pseudobythopirellula maris]TWT88279.1 HTH-type transcriptional activator CmpR [Pseudobythopirellula maris]